MNRDYFKNRENILLHQEKTDKWDAYPRLITDEKVGTAWIDQLVVRHIAKPPEVSGSKTIKAEYKG